MTRVALVDVSAQMSGVEFSTLYLAQNLDRARWQPLVICPEEGELPTQCRAHGIEVTIVPHARFFSTSMRLGNRRVPNPFAWLWNAAAFLPTARRLAKQLRASQIQLVVTKGLLAHFYGGLAARMARIPCVWHVQDRVSERMGALYPALVATAGNTFAREIIADAESIARQFRLRVSRERLTVIWNGVDTNEFSPRVDGTAVRSEWGDATNQMLIGCIARLTPWKGQHVLLDAFARVAEKFPNARLVFVGSPMFDSDDYMLQLRAQTETQNLASRVVFAGFRKDLPHVLAALDIVAHPALEKDSTPLAVVSALASGKAIVCAAVDGTAELFAEGENGLLFPPGDVDALTAQLTRVLSDGDLRKQLGQNARAFAERELSVEQFTRKCEAIFERALEN
jgi:glycosyltransferase involved in cell wall biosynthesis